MNTIKFQGFIEQNLDFIVLSIRTGIAGVLESFVGLVDRMQAKAQLFDSKRRCRIEFARGRLPFFFHFRAASQVKAFGDLGFLGPAVASHEFESRWLLLTISGLRIC